MVALPLGFERVTACLQGDPSPATTVEVHSDLPWPEVAIKPTVATMYASHMIQDEASGVTYMEPVTTSIGQVALAHAPSGPEPPTHYRGYHGPPHRRRL